MSKPISCLSWSLKLSLVWLHMGFEVKFKKRIGSLYAQYWEGEALRFHHLLHMVNSGLTTIPVCNFHWSDSMYFKQNHCVCTLLTSGFTIPFNHSAPSPPYLLPLPAHGVCSPELAESGRPQWQGRQGEGRGKMRGKGSPPWPETWRSSLPTLSGAPPGNRLLLLINTNK